MKTCAFQNQATGRYIRGLFHPVSSPLFFLPVDLPPTELPPTYYLPLKQLEENLTCTPSPFPSSAYHEWKVQPIPGGHVIIENAQSGLLLDSNFQKEVYLHQANGGDYQKWIIMPSSSGKVKVKNLKTGFFLDSNGEGKIYTHEGNDGNYQEWKMIDLPSHHLKVLSFNILFEHYPFLNPPANNKWREREYDVKHVVYNYHPDVCCLQEAKGDRTVQQEEDMRKWGGVYNAWIPAGKTGGGLQGLCDESSLSPISDFSLHPRLECIQRRFIHKRTGRSFTVFGCHLHNDKNDVKQDERMTIQQKINKIISTLTSPSEPTIICGDFNLSNPPPFPGFQLASQVKPPPQNIPTFVGQTCFDPKKEGSVIDHILVSNHFKVEYFEVIDDRRLEDSSLLPSDHRPVFAMLSFK